MITDGKQTETGGYTPLDQASQGIKNKGVEVYSLGVGVAVNSEQLRQIASSDQNVFSSPTFQDLVNFVNPIVEKSCPIKGKTTASPTPGNVEIMFYHVKMGNRRRFLQTSAS